MKSIPQLKEMLCLKLYVLTNLVKRIQNHYGFIFFDHNKKLVY